MTSINRGFKDKNEDKHLMDAAMDCSSFIFIIGDNKLLCLYFNLESSR